MNPSVLLILLPIVALIVPQGTMQRTYVPETIFVAYATLTLVVAFLRPKAGRHFGRISSSALTSPVVAFIAYFVLVNPTIAYLREVPPTDILYVTIQLAAFCFLIILAVNRANIAIVRTCTQSVGISAIILAGVIVYLFLTGQTFGDSDRVTGIEGDRSLTLPLVPAGFLLTLLLATTSTDFRAKLFWFIGTALCLAAVLAGVTRGALLAILAGGAITLLALRPKQILKAKFILWGIYLVVLATPLMVSFADAWMLRFFGQEDSDDATILGRLDEYTAFFEGFLDAPFFGQGVGHRYVFRSEYDMILSYLGIVVCHNHFFFFLGSTGIVGVTLYYGVVLAAFYRLFRVAGDFSLPPEYRNLAAQLLGMGVCGFVFTLSSTTFTALTYNISLALVVYASTLPWRSPVLSQSLLEGVSRTARLFRARTGS